METKSRRSCPLPSPLSVMHYLCFNFLVTVFVFGPRDGPADSPGSNPGGVCITPFYLYKKKNDGLKNVLRKKNVLFYK